MTDPDAAKPRHFAIDGPIGVGKTELAKRLARSFGFGNRSFVAQPLCALAPQLRLPDGSTLRELAARLPPLSPATGRLP